MSLLAPLRIPEFRNLWLGQAISQIGDALYYVVFMFMVKRVTGSNEMVGIVGALETLPYLFFSAYAGVYADKIDRRKLMLLGDIACGLLLVLFAAICARNPNPPFLVIGVIAFTLSSIRVFFWPAKSASIPRLVSEDQVMAANSLSSMTQNFMFLAGLAFSAGVLGILMQVSPTWFYVLTFALNAVSFFGSAYFIAKLPAIVPEREDLDKHPVTEMVEGIGFIKKRPELKALLGLQLMLTMFLAPFFPVYIATNDQWFGGPSGQGKPATLSWMEFGFFGGYIIGSAFVGKINFRYPGLGFIGGLSACGLLIAGMAFSPYFWPFWVLNFLCGIVVPFASIPTMTYIQVTVEDAFRGRVNSALNMCWMGAQPLGLALAGIGIEKLGIVKMFLIMGCGMALASMLGLVHKPFRSMQLPSSQKEDDAGSKDDGDPKTEDPLLATA